MELVISYKIRAYHMLRNVRLDLSGAPFYQVIHVKEHHVKLRLYSVKKTIMLGYIILFHATSYRVQIYLG